MDPDGRVASFMWHVASISLGNFLLLNIKELYVVFPLSKLLLDFGICLTALGTAGMGMPEMLSA